MIRMVVPFNVLVYEYFTGGGFPVGNLPDGIATEALGILWALLADFKSWGAIHTVTALDSRFEDRIPGLNRNTIPADEVFSVSPGEREDRFLSLLNCSDAALIVAPESDGILSGLSAQVEEEGILLLGSSASATALAGNKEACANIFSSFDLPNPKTCAVDFNSIGRSVRQADCPLILKPVDGIASEGVCLVTGLSDIPAALAKLRQVTSHEKILLQSFVKGIPASVSLLVTGDRCLPLSLNRQLIRTGIPFEYLGSEVPFDHAVSGHAVELASSAVRSVPGIRGYVGVDLVIADDSIQLMEINPRLTTSYIGLRQVARLNPAQIIFEACLKGVLPESFSLEGRVVVKKDDPSTWGLGV